MVLSVMMEASIFKVVELTSSICMELEIPSLTNVNGLTIDLLGFTGAMVTSVEDCVGDVLPR
jgi:hypothetical protein